MTSTPSPSPSLFIIFILITTTAIKKRPTDRQTDRHSQSQQLNCQLIGNEEEQCDEEDRRK